MKSKFIPDYRFAVFSEVTIEFLLSNGIKGVLLDIDNTLEPYENPTPGPHVVAWLKSLEENGIKAAFVSNNGKNRVELFNEKLGLPAYYKAKKPFKTNLIKALSDINCKPSDAIFIGDQIFTDVYAAKRMGMRAVLLTPINDKRDPFTKFKRMLEKPFLKKYEKMNGEKK